MLVVMSNPQTEETGQLASGVIFGPTVGVLSHWFKRRRGLALGLMGVGSSTGGVIFPVAFRKLVEQVG